MVKRIDTIKRLRRSVPLQKTLLERDLKRAGLTEAGVKRLEQRIECLYEDERNLKLYETWYADLGDSWAKDDWPHARARELPRSGSNYYDVPLHGVLAEATLPHVWRNS